MTSMFAFYYSYDYTAEGITERYNIYNGQLTVTVSANRIIKMNM